MPLPRSAKNGFVIDMPISAREAFSITQATTGFTKKLRKMYMKISTASEPTL